MSKYPVVLTGHAMYAAALAALNPRDPVKIVHETGNPYDADALAVYGGAKGEGGKIGYVPKDSWLRRAIIDEHKPVTAELIEVSRSDRGYNVAIIAAVIGGEAAPVRAFVR